MTMSRSEITQQNAAMFDSPKLAAWYGRRGLYPAEAAYLTDYAKELHGRPMLDLGVGSGRTTEPLLFLSQDYLGVDLSPAMLEQARSAFPTADFTEMDVLDIASLGGGRFGFVHGALAILSAFGHEERLGLLQAVRDVLQPDGLFIFSAHNRAWRRAGGMPLHARSWRPSQIVNSLHPLSWFNYLRLRDLREEADDHAILLDEAHRWRGVFYFIDMEAQKRQLEAAGFVLVDVYGENGRRVAAGDDVSDDGLLHYVCRPANGPSPAHA